MKSITSLSQMFNSSVLCALLLLAAAAAAAAGADDAQPIDVLRANVDAAIAVLEDPRYQSADQQDAQRARLCEIARAIFDPYMFSKLSLGAHWHRFSAEEKESFVEVVADYLCRYYLTRLQRHYSDENVTYIDQTFRSSHIAAVRAEVHWNNNRVPVRIRMTLRDGRWKAYDLELLGISAVRLYRSQFDGALAEGSPAELIASLRDRTLAMP